MVTTGGGTLQLFTVIICATQIRSQSSDWASQKYSLRARGIEVVELKSIAEQSSQISFESLLNPILVPRFPGTPSHAKVKDYIVGEMKKLNWGVEIDAFEDETPFGIKPFQNIIATLNPDVPRRLTLACHYDSQYKKEIKFVGAIDSAVPCAMLLHLANSLSKPLEAHTKHPGSNVTLQFIFFDGEEAFVTWTNQDSLYGSRHLAGKWEETPYPPGQRKFSELNRMDIMILLDLLGGKNPNFLNYFKSTTYWHNHLVEIENTLRRNNLFTDTSKNYFQTRAPCCGGIDDDHIPFVNRGVDILHVIAIPLPSYWHTERDNKEALDFPTIENLNRVLRVFVTSYLHLPISGS